MIAQFDPNKKIRRGGKTITISPKKKTFSYYGLNVHKNFLVPHTFYCQENGRNDEENDLSVFATEMLLHIIDSVSCAAIFCIKLDGQKLIYQIDHDFHFEDDSFMEDDPVINFTRIMKDDQGQSFSIWDADNLYDAYGLLIEIEKDRWMVIDE